MKQATEDTQLDRMLTARQVADFLQVSICSVRRWSDKGTLKFYRVGSRGDRRYQHMDVLRFLDESSRYFMPDRSSEKV
jgi:excisionase family DNA binding protein